MTGFFDCPREIRDMIYVAYFTLILEDNPRVDYNELALLRAGHNVPYEAAKVVSSRPASSPLTRADYRQAGVPVIDTGMQNTAAKLDAAWEEFESPEMVAISKEKKEEFFDRLNEGESELDAQARLKGWLRYLAEQS